MKHSITLNIIIGIFLLASSCVNPSDSPSLSDKKPPVRAAPQINSVQKEHIKHYYPDQFTYPQKQNRKCLCQFGYGLQYAQALFFPITDLLDPNNLGTHSFGKPALSEKNGMLYTCRGGFIDLSHLRVGVDWTVYLAFNLFEQTQIDLPDELATLKLTFTNRDEMTIPDVIAVAQKIAWERLLWHEVASWYKHAPNFTVGEQQSSFTPEDLYSNFAGTVIGKNVVLRILEKRDTIPFAQIATEEIEKFIAELQPVSIEGTKHAYDITDLHVQSELAEAEQNKDVWWHSGIVFRDQRYMFKRNTDIGPSLKPWLVPSVPNTPCATPTEPVILEVPQVAYSGKSLYSYYDFTITPSEDLFFNRMSKAVLHQPFNSFKTKDFLAVINHVERDMERVLHTGFNKRDSKNPIPGFDDVKETLLP